MISVTLSTRRTSGGQSRRNRPKEHRSGCSPTAFNEILEADARSMVSASSYGKPKNADNPITRPNLASHLHSAQHRRTRRWGSSSEGKVRKEGSSVMQNSCRAIRKWVVVSARCADLYSEDSRDGRQIDLTGTGAQECGVRESDRTSTT